MININCLVINFLSCLLQIYTFRIDLIRITQAPRVQVTYFRQNTLRSPDRLNKIEILKKGLEKSRVGEEKQEGEEQRGSMINTLSNRLL